MLQQEKNIRTQLEVLMKEKARRMQQLKALLEQDQDLCDILCCSPYGVPPDSVPSVEQLENFRQHVANQNAEKVGDCFPLWIKFKVVVTGGHKRQRFFGKIWFVWVFFCRM